MQLSVPIEYSYTGLIRKSNFKKYATYYSILKVCVYPLNDSIDTNTLILYSVSYMKKDQYIKIC